MMMMIHGKTHWCLSRDLLIHSFSFPSFNELDKRSLDIIGKRNTARKSTSKRIKQIHWHTDHKVITDHYTFLRSFVFLNFSGDKNTLQFLYCPMLLFNFMSPFHALRFIERMEGKILYTKRRIEQMVEIVQCRTQTEFASFQWFKSRWHWWIFVWNAVTNINEWRTTFRFRVLGTSGSFDTKKMFIRFYKKTNRSANLSIHPSLHFDSFDPWFNVILCIFLKLILNFKCLLSSILDSMLGDWFNFSISIGFKIILLVMGGIRNE